MQWFFFLHNGTAVSLCTKACLAYSVTQVCEVGEHVTWLTMEGGGFRLWRFIFLGCSQGMEETKQDTPLCPSPSCSCPVAQGQDSNQMLRTGSPEPTFVPHPESDGFRCTPLFSQVWLRYPKVQKMTLGGTEARNEVTGKSQSLFNQHSDLTNDQGSTEEGWQGGDYAFNPCNNRWSSGPGTHTHCGQ